MSIAKLEWSWTYLTEKSFDIKRYIKAITEIETLNVVIYIDLRLLIISSGELVNIPTKFPIIP